MVGDATAAEADAPIVGNGAVDGAAAADGVLVAGADMSPCGLVQPNTPQAAVRTRARCVALRSALMTPPPGVPRVRAPAPCVSCSPDPRGRAERRRRGPERRFPASEAPTSQCL